MKLPFFSKPENTKEVYFGLFLKENEGLGLLMIKNINGIEIKEKINFSYTNGWENLVEDVDELLYKFEKNHHLEISKTIFFVYSHLVDDKTNNIKKPYINKIKDLVKNLQLEALGYIECFEAVSFYLEKKEEVPLTAVLLEIDKKQLSLFVYKGGRVNYKSVLARTDNIIDDFIFAVDGIKDKKMLLPSRIVIYDSDGIDEVASKIISYKFDGNYFVQIPKIDILREDEIIEGLVQVFAGQVKSKTVEEKPVIDQSFGFVIGQDVVEREKIEEKKPTFLKFQLPKIVLPKINFPKVNWSFLKGKSAVFVGLFFIILSLFLNEYFFHKARLTIYLPTQKIEKNLTQSIDYKTGNSSAEFTETVSTSGKKDIGDKAKGSVVIHNFDDKERTFAKGTILEASGIKFVLDSDIKVASSSLAADGSAKLPGKSNASITSQNIGSEGNLAKGNRFKIDDLPLNTYFAINESNLTGGSKKEVRTVSSTDIKNLEKKVLDKTKKQAKAPSFSTQMVVLTDLSKIDIVDANYSKEVGEEGDKISLKAKIKITYYAYDKNLLIDSIIKDLKQDVKQGFVVKSNRLSYKIIDAEIDKDKINIDINAKAKAVVKFDQEKIIKNILGKNKNKLETILKSDFKVHGYKFFIDNPLPILDNYLPFFEKNIIFNISDL